MKMRSFARIAALAALFTCSGSIANSAETVPACRLDNGQAQLVEDTLRRAIKTYSAIGKPISIDKIVTNGANPPDGAKVLRVFIIADAGLGKVNAEGCATAPLSVGDPLDPMSVRGGCVIAAVERMEMRCSSSAVKIFSNVGQRRGVANPTLLYVVSHELAHLYQRRRGEYAGRSEAIDLKLNQDKKLGQLRDACDPTSTKLEEDADAMSLQVLTHLLASAPYREPVFSERGSLYWNIDLLSLATNAWRKAALEREFISQPALHSSFNPTEFPTPAAAIRQKANRFVCEVLTKRRGTILYPGKAASHPPLETRLQRIAEALAPIALNLPATGAASDFKEFSRLQADVSPIFTHIYRETGVYLEALQAQICTTVNAPRPQASCR